MKKKPKEPTLQQRAKEWIENPIANWATFPFLPMKRYGDGMECRVLLSPGSGFGKGGKYELLEVNLFSLTDMTEKEIKNLPRITYATVDAMLEDGWLVD